MPSSTGPLRKMIRSFSRREKMSKARSPRLVCSTTIGHEVHQAAHRRPPQSGAFAIGAGRRSRRRARSTSRFDNSVVAWRGWRPVAARRWGSRHEPAARCVPPSAVSVSTNVTTLSSDAIGRVAIGISAAPAVAQQMRRLGCQDFAGDDAAAGVCFRLKGEAGADVGPDVIGHQPGSQQLRLRQRPPDLRGRLGQFAFDDDGLRGVVRTRLRGSWIHSFEDILQLLDPLRPEGAIAVDPGVAGGRGRADRCGSRRADPGGAPAPGRRRAGRPDAARSPAAKSQSRPSARRRSSRARRDARRRRGASGPPGRGTLRLRSCRYISIHLCDGQAHSRRWSYPALLPNQRDQAIADAGGVFGVALQLDRERALLHDRADGEHRYHDRRQGESLPGAQQQRRAQKEECGAGIHGVAHIAVGAGGHDLVAALLLDLHHRRGVGVLAKRQIDEIGAGERDRARPGLGPRPAYATSETAPRRAA